MLRLPDPTRARLKGFWLVASAGAGLVIAAALALSGEPGAAPWGLAIAAASSAVGLRWPGIAAFPYRAWNRWAGLVERGARVWLSGTCFLIVTLVSALGSRLTWRKAGTDETGWVPKRRLPEERHAGVSGSAPHPEPGSGWLRSYAAWARDSDQLWAWSLLPFLALLAAVEPSPKGRVAGNIYTLY